MSILSGLAGIFTGSGMKSVENIAKEIIETSKDKAEAQAVMLKTLDPNGMMRRYITETVCKLYVVYVVVTLVLIILQSFGFNPEVTAPDGSVIYAVDKALDNSTALFKNISVLFGTIVSISFGVNSVNAYKNK